MQADLGSLSTGDPAGFDSVVERLREVDPPAEIAESSRGRRRRLRDAGRRGWSHRPGGPETVVAAQEHATELTEYIADNCGAAGSAGGARDGAGVGGRATPAGPESVLSTLLHGAHGSLRCRRERFRRRVRPTTSAGCPDRPARHRRSGGSGTSWSWSPTRSSRAGPVGADRRGEADVRERLIETGDRSAVHLLVRPVAAVDPHDRGLVAVGRPSTSSARRAPPPSTPRAARCARGGTRG